MQAPPAQAQGHRKRFIHSRVFYTAHGHPGISPYHPGIPVRVQVETMSKRISMTLSDDEYAALVQAVGVIITTTGTTTNLTQYIRDAIIGAVCRDLKLNQLSDYQGIKKE